MVACGLAVVKRRLVGGIKVFVIAIPGDQWKIGRLF